MQKQFRLVFLALGILSSAAWAADSSTLSHNLNDLSSQINKLNQDLENKQQQKQHIEHALKDSQGAIFQSEALLSQLRQQRDADLQQLKQLIATLPELAKATQQAREHVSQSIKVIYQQVRQIQNSQQSIFSANELAQSRKKHYLLELLKLEQRKYEELSQKLVKLDGLNEQLQAEVARLNAKLGETSQQHQRLLQLNDQTLKQSTAVKRQIRQDQNQLSNLKQRQVQLNRLLLQLAVAEKKQRVRQQSAKRVATSAQVQPATASYPQPISVEDNSAFLQRKLVKPLNGRISVGFGQMRDSVRNNGLLLNCLEEQPVYSISRGKVLFSGELPGFGQIIVLDNGDNYTSVYSGILSKVVKNTTVVPGQLIASTGSKANQPMGGVYFELRHLGKPVNPTKLFN